MTPRPPQAVRMTLNLAPMVDVMMCLIIFFLLGSRLVSESATIDLAEARAAEQIARAPELLTVTVNVADRPEASGPAYSVAVGNRRAAEPLDADSLPGFLAGQVEAAGDAERVRCIVRADREVVYAGVERVLRACGSAGVSRVVFGATPLEGD